MNTDPLIGRQLANYKIERLLGAGGMGKVYYGKDVKLMRSVAIKVIDERFSSDPEYVKRMINEARLVAPWRHENIAQIYYADELNGLHYFVMEFIDGQNLADLLEAYAADGELVNPKDILMVGRAIASALDYAHQRGVVHRDVKPGNVIIDRNGRAFLTDFGLARDTSEAGIEQALGSAHYISPEQARNPDSAGPASDIYSFGVMLYEMFTGVVPFDDPNPRIVALRHRTQPPPRPRSINPLLTPSIEAILIKTLEKDPANRFKTAEAIMDALDTAIDRAASQELDVLPLPPLPARHGTGRLVSPPGQAAQVPASPGDIAQTGAGSVRGPVTSSLTPGASRAPVTSGLATGTPPPAQPPVRKITNRTLAELSAARKPIQTELESKTSLQPPKTNGWKDLVKNPIFWFITIIFLTALGIGAFLFWLLTQM